MTINQIQSNMKGQNYLNTNMNPTPILHITIQVIEWYDILYILMLYPTK